MPLPRLLGRINRRLTNPILWPIVARLPGAGFGRIVHVGRRSGRVYRTPMLGFGQGDRVVFALTYGSRTQWVQNVLASGRCDFETRRGTRHLVEPRLFRDANPQFVPSVIGAILRGLHAHVFLELRILPEAKFRGVGQRAKRAANGRRDDRVGTGGRSAAAAAAWAESAASIWCFNDRPIGVRASHSR